MKGKENRQNQKEKDMFKGYNFKNLNGCDVWFVLNFLTEMGCEYTYEIDEDGEGEIIEGSYYADGHYDFTIENFVVVWTEQRFWD